MTLFNSPRCSFRETNRMPLSIVEGALRFLF